MAPPSLVEISLGQPGLPGPGQPTLGKTNLLKDEQQGKWPVDPGPGRKDNPEHQQRLGTEKNTGTKERPVSPGPGQRDNPAATIRPIIGTVFTKRHPPGSAGEAALHREVDSIIPSSGNKDLADSVTDLPRAQMPLGLNQASKGPGPGRPMSIKDTYYPGTPAAKQCFPGSSAPVATPLVPTKQHAQTNLCHELVQLL
jgi:hypothetical protein